MSDSPSGTQAAALLAELSCSRGDRQLLLHPGRCAQAVGPDLLRDQDVQPASRVGAPCRHAPRALPRRRCQPPPPARRLASHAAPPCAAPPPRCSAAFTIHGLWPNYANGGYPQDCDPTNKFSTTNLPQPLLNQMSCEWVSYTGSNAAFW